MELAHWEGPDHEGTPCRFRLYLRFDARSKTVKERGKWRCLGDLASGTEFPMTLALIVSNALSYTGTLALNFNGVREI